MEENIIQDIAYYPFLVPDEDRGDSVETIRQNRALFQGLTEKEQDILTARELPEILLSLQNGFGLERDDIFQLSRLIRWFFYKKLSWEEFGVRVESILLARQGNAEKAKDLIGRLESDIIQLNPKVITEDVLGNDATPDKLDTKEKLSGKITLPILKALTDYPQIHNQRVTQEKIRIRTERDSVAPNVRNWLRAYRDVFGIGNHNAIDRGKFLFQNDNTKHLTQDDRDRVALILKSLDENDPIPVDPGRGEIVFPASVKTNSVETSSGVSVQKPVVPIIKPFIQPADSPASAPPDHPFAKPINPVVPPEAQTRVIRGGSLQFSSGHILPGERARYQEGKDTSEEVIV